MTSFTPLSKKSMTPFHWANASFPGFFEKLSCASLTAVGLGTLVVSGKAFLGALSGTYPEEESEGPFPSTRSCVILTTSACTVLCGSLCLWWGYEIIKDVKKKQETFRNFNEKFQKIDSLYNKTLLAVKSQKLKPLECESFKTFHQACICFCQNTTQDTLSLDRDLSHLQELATLVMNKNSIVS